MYNWISYSYVCFFLFSSFFFTLILFIANLFPCSMLMILKYSTGHSVCTLGILKCYANLYIVHTLFLNMGFYILLRKQKARLTFKRRHAQGWTVYSMSKLHPDQMGTPVAMIIGGQAPEAFLDLLVDLFCLTVGLRVEPRRQTVKTINPRKETVVTWNSLFSSFTNRLFLKC